MIIAKYHWVLKTADKQGTYNVYKGKICGEMCLSALQNLRGLSVQKNLAAVTNIPGFVLLHFKQARNRGNNQV